MCTSNDTRDKRLRASLFFQSKEGNVLVDSGPDLREQMLRKKLTTVNAVLYTHFHFDHLDGLPDLRPFTFDSKDELKCYANPQTHEVILTRYPYIRNSAIYTNVPRIGLHLYPGDEEDGYRAVEIAGMEFQPIRLVHIPQSGVLSTGFVVNKKFGYLTDFKEIHHNDEKYLYNLDILYLGSPIDHPHVSHIQQQEALELFKKFNAKRGVIGHLSHQYMHEELLARWQGQAEPAFDGQEFHL
ncbi:MAG TPA: MBL fold metallo-hydrolase [Turneriella sp.]|nr:MBL fold metallo-hydrolase [Turneriella sp.]